MNCSRYNEAFVHAFTEIDGDTSSNSLIEFIESRGFSLGFTNCERDTRGGIVRGLNLFAATPLPDGPKAMVALQGTSPSAMSEIVELANSNNVSIFTAGLQDPAADPARTAARTAIAVNTGGVHVAASEAADTGETLTTIIAWLKDGYRMTLAQTAANDCNPHMLEVTVRGESDKRAFFPLRFDA